MPSAKKKPPKRVDPLISRDKLLAEFGMLTLEELATLFGVDFRTLQNRGKHNLPPHSKVGGKMLFFKDDVVAYMRKNMER